MVLGGDGLRAGGTVAGERVERFWVERFFRRAELDHGWHGMHGCRNRRAEAGRGCGGCDFATPPFAKATKGTQSLERRRDGFEMRELGFCGWADLRGGAGGCRVGAFAAPALVSANRWQACVEPGNSSPVLTCVVGPVDSAGEAGLLFVFFPSLLPFLFFSWQGD
jgi:hypothetical protein